MWEKQEEEGENTQMKETTKDSNKDISSLPLSLSEKQPLIFD